MKRVLFLIGGILSVLTWQANAQEPATPNPSPANPETVVNSEGPDLSSKSMSGGAAMSQGKTRADVYQDLVRSQRDGEATRLQELFRGGN